MDHAEHSGNHHGYYWSLAWCHLELRNLGMLAWFWIVHSEQVERMDKNDQVKLGKQTNFEKGYERDWNIFNLSLCDVGLALVCIALSRTIPGSNAKTLFQLI